MRGLRSTLVLLIVLAGLGGYIYFVESKREPSSDGEKKEKVFAVEADKIQELSVRAESGAATTLKKAGTSWQIVSPEQVPADAAEVSGITTNLASLEIQRVVDEAPADLKGFGLDPARVDVAFKTAGAKDFQHLLLGEKTATGGDLYARLSSGKKVFLVSGYLDSSFNRTTFDLREKSALKFDRDKADAIEIQTPDHRLKLTKNGSEWRLAEPVQARADFGTVEGILGRLNTAQMKGITAPQAADLKPYGLDTPAATVTLGAGSARATLLVGSTAEEGKVYARDTSRPMVFTIESSLLDELKKGASEYRRKDLFEFRPFSATRLELTRDGKPVIFEKVKAPGKDAKDTVEKWKQTAPAAREIDQGKFESLLSKVSNLRAQSFEDGAAAGSPSLIVIARFDEGKKEDRVTFTRSGTDVFATRPDEPGRAKVDTSEFDDALKSLDELK